MIGVGGVGLNILSGARLVGAERIIAVDTQAAKADLADKFGATDFIDASSGDVVTLLNAIVPGGVDHVCEVVGLKSTSEQAVKLVIAQRLASGSVFVNQSQIVCERGWNPALCGSGR